MDSPYQKTPEMMYFMLSLGKGIKNYIFKMAAGGHFGFMQITRVAQSCQFGNQAEIV